MQSRLPLAQKEAAPKAPPSRQTSSAQALPPTVASSGSGAAEPGGDKDGQLARSQSRAPRASGLGRFLSRMGMAGEAVAPEVSLKAIPAQQPSCNCFVASAVLLSAASLLICEQDDAAWHS